MRTDLIKIIATIIALIFGLFVFATVPGLALILFLSTVGGIFVWIFMGKVYTSGGVIRFVLWLRGRTIAGFTDEVDVRDLDSLEKGYFILEAEAKERAEEEATQRFRFWSHVREALERPWVPILFLISLGINLLKFADFIPALGVELTFEEATEFLLNVNMIIFFVSPIILGFIMPGLFLLHDFSLYFFQRVKGTLEIEKSSGFGQKLLEGFVGGSALLGFIKFLIELATAPSELAGFIALVFLIAIGASAHSIVWTLFFYLYFHRRYVKKLNTKLEKIGLPLATVEIKLVEEKVPTVRIKEEASIGITKEESEIA